MLTAVNLACARFAKTEWTSSSPHSNHVGDIKSRWTSRESSRKSSRILRGATCAGESLLSSSGINSEIL